MVKGFDQVIVWNILVLCFPELFYVPYAFWYVVETFQDVARRNSNSVLKEQLQVRHCTSLLLDEWRN